MKNKIQLVGALLIGLHSFGQELHTKRCATVDYMHYREAKQAGYIQSVNDVYRNALSVSPEKSDEKYYIPVVVHVVYNTPEQNLHDSIIHNQIRILNEDFGRKNADSVNLRAAFLPHVGRGNIEFVLAQFDPNGNPTTGITRTHTTHSTFAGSILEMMSGDISSIERVKSTAQGGVSPWNQTRYMNIWVCNMAVDFMGTEMPMILGYATPPDGLPNWPAGSTGGLDDGVVIQYQVFGSNNPNNMNQGGQPYVVKGRTVTHEVGHYLGLRHIWGDGDCTQDDGIADTPNANDASEGDCNKTKNTCVDNINGVNLPDMVENFMDYSAEDCQNTFTAGQIQLVRAVLENNRFDLINNNPALSISQIDQLNVALYPNPTKENVLVKLDKNINGKLFIIDLNGKTVKEQIVNGTESNVNVQDLQNGVYQLVIENDNRTKTIVKLVKM